MAALWRPLHPRINVLEKPKEESDDASNSTSDAGEGAPIAHTFVKISQNT